VRQPYARVDYIPPVRDEEFGSREWYVCDPRIIVADKVKKKSGGNSFELVNQYVEFQIQDTDKKS
jgi:hypothetical protein